jgi:hypothetical protein
MAMRRTFVARSGDRASRGDLIVLQWLALPDKFELIRKRAGYRRWTWPALQLGRSRSPHKLTEEARRLVSSLPF